MDFPSPRNLHHISSRGLFQIVEVIPYLRIDANPYKEENLFTLFLMQGIIRKQHYLTTHHSPYQRTPREPLYKVHLKYFYMPNINCMLLQAQLAQLSSAHWSWFMKAILGMIFSFLNISCYIYSVKTVRHLVKVFACCLWTTKRK
jgi:hypothetical protein